MLAHAFVPRTASLGFLMALVLSTTTPTAADGPFQSNARVGDACGGNANEIAISHCSKDSNTILDCKGGKLVQGLDCGQAQHCFSRNKNGVQEAICRTPGVPNPPKESWDCTVGPLQATCNDDKSRQYMFGCQNEKWKLTYCDTGKKGCTEDSYINKDGSTTLTASCEPES